jgi:hypothetical protein
MDLNLIRWILQVLFAIFVKKGYLADFLFAAGLLLWIIMSKDQEKVRCAPFDGAGSDTGRMLKPWGLERTI